MARKRIVHQPIDIRMALGLKLPPSEEEILAARTPKGAWTQATFASWGIAWPPRAGWRIRLARCRERILRLCEQSSPPAC
jgi:hypothetical protein